MRHIGVDLHKTNFVGCFLSFVLLKKELDYWYLEDRLSNRKLRLLNAAA